MSLVTILVPSRDPGLQLLTVVRSVTNESFERIRLSIRAGLPIYKKEIFGNTHEERAAEIRELLSELEGLHVTPRIIKNRDEVSAQVLLNILETSDEIARDIEREDDEGAA